MKFHALETLSGVLLVVGMIGGLVSLWLLPIAVSLICAVPLSLLSGLGLNRWRTSDKLLTTPEHTNPPEILTAARYFRRMFRTPQIEQLAAE